MELGDDININFIAEGAGNSSGTSPFVGYFEFDFIWWTQQDSLGIFSLDSLSSLQTPFYLIYSFSDENNVLILKDNKPFLEGCAEIHFNRVIEMSLYNSIALILEKNIVFPDLVIFLQSETERLKQEGFELIGDIREGADNKLVCFIHPKSANGVLVELCQEK